MEDGSLNPMDAAILKMIGKWIKRNKDFIYGVKSCDIKCTGADLLKGDDGYYYAVIKKVPLFGDPNVVLEGGKKPSVTVGAKIRSAEWLDNGQKIEWTSDNAFDVGLFKYGTSLCMRIAKLGLEDNK